MDSFIRFQAYTFFIFILNGCLIAFIFDIFRIFRKSFNTPDIITYIEDILFWLITCILLAYSIYTYNNGEIRVYMFFALLIGVMFYILTISKYVVKFSVKMIYFVRKIFQKVFFYILYPIKFILKCLKKLLYKPICFIFINFRKNLKIIQKNVNKMTKAQK